MKIARSSTLVALVTALVGTRCLAGDWPNWRGPSHDGTTTEKVRERNWPKQGPRLLWKASVGIGYSSVAVRDGRAVTLGFSADGARSKERERDGTDTVWCFAADTGKVLWKHSYACPRWAIEHEGGPATTPALGRDRAYTLSKEGHLFALRLRDGKVVWERNIRKEFKVARRPSKPHRDYGYTGSPLVLDDLLIVPVGGRGASTVAFRLSSGDVVWKSGNRDGKSGAGYGAPVPFEWKGATYIAVFDLAGLEVLEARSGARRASYPWVTDFGLNIATPCVSGSRIFITSSYGRGSAIVEFTGTSLREVDKDPRTKCKFTSPVVWRDHVYACSDGGILRCIELSSGKTRWQRRSLGNAFPLMAGNKMLLVGERGDLAVAAVSPKEYRVLQQVSLHRGRCWSAPALAGGRLYVRNTHGDLACYDVGVE